MSTEDSKGGAASTVHLSGYLRTAVHLDQGLRKQTHKRGCDEMAKHEERAEEDRGRPDSKKGTQGDRKGNDPDKPDSKHGK
jgi:hypothetical protein